MTIDWNKPLRIKFSHIFAVSYIVDNIRIAGWGKDVDHIEFFVQVNNDGAMVYDNLFGQRGAVLFENVPEEKYILLFNDPSKKTGWILYYDKLIDESQKTEYFTDHPNFKYVKVNLD